MAKQILNSPGWLILKLNIEEAEHLGIGVYRTGRCICMKCDKDCGEEIYLIPAVSDTCCSKCLPRFIKTATRYKEDIPYETQKFNYYKEALGIFYDGEETYNQ